MTKKKLTPCQAIKHYCRFQCCANDLLSWKECTAKAICPLYPYRMGKRPKTKEFQEYTKKPIVLPIKSSKNNESSGGVQE